MSIPSPQPDLPQFQLRRGVPRGSKRHAQRAGIEGHMIDFGFTLADALAQGVVQGGDPARTAPSTLARAARRVIAGEGWQSFVMLR